MQKSRRFSVALNLIAAFLFVIALPAFAQDGNLLINGGMEEGSFGPYVGKGRPDLNVPAGWDIWLGQGPTDQFLNRGDKVFGFPHRAPGPNPVEGTFAANLSGGFVQFNAALLQTVNVASGANLRLVASAQMKACNTSDGKEGQCGSDLNGGAQTRVGIDPNGGNDPNAPEIVWSPWFRPHDRWDIGSVEATATGAQVTVFLFYTQDKVYVNNRVYWDNALLTVGGAGGASAAAGTAIPPTATPQPFVPFVSAQGARDDGSIVHTVQSGDTIDSIAVAYGTNRQAIVDLNPNLASIRFLQIGQQIVIRPPQTPTETPDEPEEPTPTAISGGVIESTVVPAEATAAADATAGVEVASVPTSAADPLVEVINPDPKGANTDTPTELPQPTPTATFTEEAEAPTETATEVPPTATSFPTPIPTVDLAATTVTICVSLFDDQNQNRVREGGEELLAGGVIRLERDGQEVVSHNTDGVSEPSCLSDLPAGSYEASVALPVGFGPTTSEQLFLPLTAGSVMNIEFGAAEGVEVAMAPQTDTTSAEQPQTGIVSPPDATEDRSVVDRLIAISGFIVAALAAVVVIAGIGATLLLRRGR